LEKQKLQTNNKGGIKMAKYQLPFEKQSVASEMRVSLGPETSSRQNGSVGGQMVKKTFEYIDKNKTITR
jgi:hypothetical protein